MFFVLVYKGLATDLEDAGFEPRIFSEHEGHNVKRKKEDGFSGWKEGERKKRVSMVTLGLVGFERRENWEGHK